MHPEASEPAADGTAEPDCVQEESAGDHRDRSVAGRKEGADRRPREGEGGGGPL